MNLGSLKVLIGANIDPLLKDLKKAEKALQATGRNFQNIGDNLMKLSAPLIGVGVATVKMAMEFESSMNKINSLVGVSKEELKKMTPELKRMAAEYGISSQKAADALYFITSAGLKGADAMNVLEASLKASATGLGEVSTIADLATSAVNAYGSGVLNGSAATDVLAAAVREGKLEAASLATTMGQIIPMASAMGVSFDEVGAAYAAMSRTGTNASAATSQLRGILSTLLKPTKEGSDMLDSMGISAESLRAKIKEDGLLSVLQLLKEKFEGNDAALATVFGNVEALTGVMNMMGAGAEITADIFDKLKNSTGDLDGAWAGMSQDSTVRMNKMMVSFQNVGLQIGEKLLPAFEKIIEKVQGFVDWLATLDAATIANAVEIALWVGGIGAAFKVFGMLVSGISGAIGTFTKLLNLKKDLQKAQVALNLAMTANPVGLVIAAVAALVALIVIIIKKYESWGAAVALLFGPIGFLINLIKSFARHWDSIVDAFKSDGIIAGLKRIGLVILDALLMPLQQLLKLAEKLPGVGKYAGMAADKIESLRAKLNLITPEKKTTGTIGGNWQSIYGGSSGSGLPKPPPVLSANNSDTESPGGPSGGPGNGPTEEELDKLKQARQLEADLQVVRKLGAEEKLGQDQAITEGLGMVNSQYTTAIDLTGVLANQLDHMSESAKNLGEALVVSAEEQWPLLMEQIENMTKNGSLMEKVFGAVTMAVVDMAESGVSSFKELAQGVIGAAAKIIRAQIMIGVSAAVAKTFQSAPWPLNLIAGPLAGAAAGMLFSALISKITAPRLAKGGLAFGETMAMVGDNPNAHVDPEVISPLSKLKSMMGAGNVNINLAGHFKLNGNDLMLVVQKAEVNQLRTRGYVG
jgi:TP901 family phage tail tape measure protein